MFKKIVLFIFSTILFLGFLSFKDKSVEEHSLINFPPEQAIEEEVEKRIIFFEDHLQVLDLLKAYEADSYEFSVFNDSKQSKSIPADLIFLNDKKISEEINILDSDSNDVKVRKIFEFVSDNFSHTYPVFDYYQSFLSDDTVASFFFPIYGSGLCSNVSISFAELARKYGFKARVWSFNGHVAAEVFYDGQWHFFDPDTLGFFEGDDGIIMSLASVKQMATNMSLEKYNSIISSEEDNSIIDLNVANPNLSLKLENLNFYPKEEEIYFSKLFMIPSNAEYLSDEGYPLEYGYRSFLTEHERGGVANFIREIPLKNFENGSVRIDSFFPIAGVFISVPKFRTIFNKLEIVPEARFQSDLINDENWVAYRLISDENLNMDYLDFSLALKYLENNPSHELELRNIGSLVKNFPNSKLLLVSFYSYRNADLNLENNLINNDFNIAF